MVRANCKYIPAPSSFINSGSFVSFEASIEVFESPSGGRRKDGGCGAPPQPADVKATQFNQNKLEDVGYRMENWKVFTDLGVFLPLPWLEGDAAEKEKLLKHVARALGMGSGSG